MYYMYTSQGDLISIEHFKDGDDSDYIEHFKRRGGGGGGSNKKKKEKKKSEAPKPAPFSSIYISQGVHTTPYCCSQCIGCKNCNVTC